MGKFFESKEFKDLNHQWAKKLKDNDFKDIEDSKENLKQHDRRTVAFDNRLALASFFTKLEEYIRTTKLNQDHKKVLSLYAQGIHNKGPQGIASQTGFSDRWIKMIIAKHKKIVLAIK